MVEITAAYPAGVIGTTIENLKAAADGENEEWDILYPEFGKIAGEEGFPKVATAFKMIGSVEVQHEIRYRKLLANILDGSVFKKEGEVEWQCRNCGYVHVGANAPESCPSCLHPKAFFELRKTNY
jgi:rubrerythrin